MPKIIFSKPAQQDLFKIWDYIAIGDFDAADKVVRKIEEKCLMLSTSSAIGKKRDELAKNLRSFPVGNYIIFYRIIADGIQVVRVLHSAQDITKLF